MGLKPSSKEWLGVSITIVGCVLMLLDPKAERQQEQSSSLWPAILDISSAFFGATYFLLLGKCVKDFPICFLVLTLSLHTFIWNCSMAKIY
jgi:drug/metabolite transporter (DMT)-like permease